MLGWFGKRKRRIDIRVDIHSHLIPGIDDGARDLQESVELCTALHQLGIEKLITTPHIYEDHYPNTPESINNGLLLLKEELNRQSLQLELEAAAEYFVDASLMELIDSKSALLSFGENKYVLIETAFFSKPLIFDEAIFKLKAAGYSPVLAHPERYEYLEQDYSWLKKIREGGVKLQVSVPSIGGYYGKSIRKTAKKLFELEMVDFVGTDLHRRQQIPGLKQSFGTLVRGNELLNNSLL